MPRGFPAETSGAVADYIPELGKADPAHFGISLATLDGHVYEVGDTQIPFTIQSMSKPFVFALALDTLGAARVESAIGVEPSGDPFNSIRLNAENHPFNPMVNAGAIACSGLIHEAKGDGAFEYIRQALGRFAGRELDVDDAVYASESATGDRNRAIGYLLRTNAVIKDNVASVLDVYFRQCAILVTARDIAVMAATLANRGVNPVTGEQVMSALRHFAHAVGDDVVPACMTMPANGSTASASPPRAASAAASSPRCRRGSGSAAIRRSSTSTATACAASRSARRCRRITTCTCSTAATTRATASSPTTISATARRGA